MEKKYNAGNKKQSGNKFVGEKKQTFGSKSATQWKDKAEYQKKDGKSAPQNRKYTQDAGKSAQTNQKATRQNSNNKFEQKGQERKPSAKKPGMELCPAFTKCGGCQLLDKNYDKQLKLKKEQVSELLKPYGKIEEIVGMEHPEHYRHKVHAVFGRERGVAISGVYKEGTHIIVPIEECLLENQKADAIIQTVKGLLKSFKIKTYNEDTDYGLLRHVLVRVGYKSGQVMVVLVLASPIMPSKNNFVKALRKEHPEITTVIVNVNDKRTSMILGDKEQVIYGPGYIEDELCGMTFKISPKSFYQVNPKQTEVLYQSAMDYAGLTGKETVLDAYCGTGTIGMIAAAKAKKVIGVELNRDAVRDAVANAKRNSISNIEFFQADAGEFMVKTAEEGGKVDVVLMDPPRGGSDEKFLSSVAKLKPEKVVYVSCNPETLARDLKYLTENGYRMVKGKVVDMFPFTVHVEAVIKMQYCGVEKKK